MGEISALAEWLRQRHGETDEAWIERLRSIFQADVSAPDDKTDRIGDRQWSRFLARLEAPKTEE